MAKKFIAGAIRHPGSLRATAKRKGLIRDGEKLSEADLKKLAASGDATTRKRVALARTLRKLRRKKR